MKELLKITLPLGNKEILSYVNRVDKNIFNNELSRWRDIKICSQSIDLAKDLEESIDTLVIIGIGGSYIGIEAAVDFLNLDREKIIFIGYSLDSKDILEKISKVKGKRVAINIISLSGNTLETIVALNIVKDAIDSKNIYKTILTTSNIDGYLYRLALKNNYHILKMPENLVGRYSTLFVSQLALSFLGIDINSIVSGAKKAIKDLDISINYAANRRYLYDKGCCVEIFQNYIQDFIKISEYWQQLFGESEGKDEIGIFPTQLFFTRDLHSMGQYIQEGKKIFFQTTLICKESENIFINKFENELQFLNNRSLSSINREIIDSTIDAHKKAGNYNIVIELPKRDALSFGYLLYFFKQSAVISCQLLNIDPYSNKGVDVYKKIFRESMKKYL